MSRRGSIANKDNNVFNFRLLLPGIGLFLFMVASAGCSEERKSTIGNVDPEVFPTMLTTDVSTLVSDSGYTRYHLTTDLWLVFDEAKEPNWKFPTGLFMERYNDSMQVESTFRSDSAFYLTNKKLWRFDGNVRMRNTDGDKFATEQLFWNQQQQKVYSDSFIHIERSDRILEGYGFESNEQMTEYTITRVSGIFPTPQRKEHNDSVRTDSIGRNGAGAAPVPHNRGTAAPDKTTMKADADKAADSNPKPRRSIEVDTKPQSPKKVTPARRQPEPARIK